jgi:hypothetical protein
MNQPCRLFYLAAISSRFRRPPWTPKCSYDSTPTPRRWDQHQRSKAAFFAPSVASPHFGRHRGPQLKSLPIAIVLLLMTSINMQAQAAFTASGDLPNSPSTSFWTKANTTLLALDAAAKGADFYYTMRGMDHPGLALEADPIARPFVSHGNALAVGYFGGLLVMDAAVSYELHKHHHDRLSKAVLIFGIVNNGYGAQYDGRQY